MSIQGELLQTTPCPGGPANCSRVYRTLYGQLNNTGATGSNISGSANMAAYLTAALNNQLTGADAVNNINTLGWSETRYLVFDTYTDTTPTGGVSVAQDGGHPFSRTDYWTNGPYQIASPTCDIIVTQIWLGAPTAFMVLGTGFQIQPTGGLELACEGCTVTPVTYSVCGAGLLVNLPIPNPALAGPNAFCFEYTYALVGPNTTGGLTGQYPDITTMANDLIGTGIFGPNWNPALVCGPATGDPFA